VLIQESEFVSLTSTRCCEQAFSITKMTNLDCELG